MEERQRRANEEEKERCVLKRKTPRIVVSRSFVDLVRGDKFGSPVSRKCVGYRGKKITLIIVIFLKPGMVVQSSGVHHHHCHLVPKSLFHIVAGLVLVSAGAQVMTRVLLSVSPVHIPPLQALFSSI